jgi:hypothetical protein
MLNLDETLLFNNDYFEQKDYYLKTIFYSTAVILLIDILRSQVSEINLLQLVPGLYLLLLFLSLLFLVFFSTLLVRIPIELDNRKELGTKTINKFASVVLVKFAYFIFSIVFLLGLEFIIPLSFDSFNYYGEKTLENLWSLDEVISLEVILLFVLTNVCQVPIIGIFYFDTEDSINLLPQLWRPLVVASLIAAGIITPTVDGYTQLSFGSLFLFSFLFIVSVIQKRIYAKFPGFNSIN